MKDDNVGTLLSSLQRKQEQFNDQADQLTILKDDLKGHRKTIELSILTYMQIEDIHRLVIQDESLPEGDVWVCGRHTDPRHDGTREAFTRYQAPLVYAEDIAEIPF